MEGFIDLFKNIFSWQKEWKDMPEFVSEDLSAKRRIVINFRSDEDVEEFLKLVDQKAGPRVRSLWFPKYAIRHFMNKRYVDES